MRAAFVRTFGDAGREWLERLPGLMGGLAARWGLELTQVLPGGALSCCVAATGRGGRRCVLKLPLDPGSGVREAAALALWRAAPTPDVLRADDATGAFLMERVEVRPGAPPPPDAAVASAAAELWLAPAPGGFPALRELVESRLLWARRGAGPRASRRTRARLEAARRVADELLAGERGPESLLHGDLQPKNVLARSDGGLAPIDPLPCVGDRHYDVGHWCATRHAPAEVAAHVRELAAALRLDAGRALRWAAVVAATEPDDDDRGDAA